MHLKIILQKQGFSEIRVCIVQDSRFGDYKKASLSSLKLDLDISYTKSFLSFFHGTTRNANTDDVILW